MSDEIENSDELDPGTSKFVPLRAIYDPQFKTDVTTKCHDNVEKCIAVIEGRSQNSTTKKESKPNDEECVKLERQFSADQMPVTGHRKKEFRHVVKRMEEFQYGPLSALKRYMEEGLRIKVWTRGVSQIRGVSTGFIVAFDKHWNMALTDVDEQFTRKRSRKAPVPGGIPDGHHAGSEFKAGDSVIKVIQVKKKVEICVRHVPQVLLKGEHVVMVATDL